MHADAAHGTTSLLESVTAGVVQVMPGASAAGVTVSRRRKLVETIGATDDDARTFDLLQEDSGEGPCLDAAEGTHVVVVPDFAAETRWPVLVPNVLARTAIRSSVSYQLFTDAEELGALNVYAARAQAFPPRGVEIGYAFAAHAAIVFDAARRRQQFDSALASRDVIGQAKGVIMERFGVGATRAFALMSRLSQEKNVPVAELARTLIATDHPDVEGREPAAP